LAEAPVEAAPPEVTAAAALAVAAATTAVDPATSATTALVASSTSGVTASRDVSAPPASLAPATLAPVRSTASEVGRFAAGAASAFAIHESCHLVANLALGNVPRVSPVTYGGVIPFFTIDHGITCPGGRCVTRDGSTFGPGRPGLFLILSAGFQCQHLGDEIILTTTPDLRAQDAPFLKGMLAFNTLAAAAYVVADWGGAEPPQGDLVGLYRDARAPRNAMNGLLLGVALLDVARYVWPDVGWLAWASRTLKVGAGGVVLTL
jgi:hypothetical protein